MIAKAKLSSILLSISLLCATPHISGIIINDIIEQYLRGNTSIDDMLVEQALDGSSYIDLQHALQIIEVAQRTRPQFKDVLEALQIRIMIAIAESRDHNDYEFPELPVMVAPQPTKPRIDPAVLAAILQKNILPVQAIQEPADVIDEEDCFEVAVREGDFELAQCILTSIDPFGAHDKCMKIKSNGQPLIFNAIEQDAKIGGCNWVKLFIDYTKSEVAKLHDIQGRSTADYALELNQRKDILSHRFSLSHGAFAPMHKEAMQDRTKKVTHKEESSAASAVEGAAAGGQHTPLQTAALAGNIATLKALEQAHSSYLAGLTERDFEEALACIERTPHARNEEAREACKYQIKAWIRKYLG